MFEVGGRRSLSVMQAHDLDKNLDGQRKVNPLLPSLEKVQFTAYLR